MCLRLEAFLALLPPPPRLLCVSQSHTCLCLLVWGLRGVSASSLSISLPFLESGRHRSGVLGLRGVSVSLSVSLLFRSFNVIICRSWSSGI